MTPAIPMKSPLRNIGKRFLVYPGTIYSPSHFYVTKWKHVPKVNRYHNKIKRFLDKQQASDYGLIAPLEGKSCAVEIANIWLRANILEYFEGHCTIEFVDIGGKITLWFDKLKPLPLKLTKPSGKAIRVHLNDLIPHSENSWSAESSLFLEGLITTGPMKMKSYSIRTSSSFNSLAVDFTNSCKEINLREVLINRGFAQTGYPSDTLLSDNQLFANNKDNNANKNQDTWL